MDNRIIIKIKTYDFKQSYQPNAQLPAHRRTADAGYGSLGPGLHLQECAQRPDANPYLHVEKRSDGLSERQQREAPHPDVHRRAHRIAQRPARDNGTGPLPGAPDVQRHYPLRHFQPGGRAPLPRLHRGTLRVLPHAHRSRSAQGLLSRHRLPVAARSPIQHPQRVRQDDGEHRSRRHQCLYEQRCHLLRGEHPEQRDRQLAQGGERPFPEHGHSRFPHGAGGRL